MAKQLIIGVESGSYKDKKSGETVDFLNVHTVKHTMNSTGIVSDALWIDTDRMPTAYAAFMEYCKGDIYKLVSLMLDVSRGTRGFIENIEFLELCPDAALFDF